MGKFYLKTLKLAKVRNKKTNVKTCMSYKISKVGMSVSSPKYTRKNPTNALY